MINDVILKLMNCFPRSFIYYNGEFIANRELNAYFSLKDCKCEFDIKCKILEWFSQYAYKTNPFMLNGINNFLETNFSKEDIETIYQYLGNRINHELTKQFVNSNYCMDLFKPNNEKGDE